MFGRRMVFREIEGNAQVLQLASLGAEIAMADIYDKLIFAAPEKWD